MQPVVRKQCVERQGLSRTYLAHHEPDSKLLSSTTVIIIVTIILSSLLLLLVALSLLSLLLLLLLLLSVLVFIVISVLHAGVDQHGLAVRGAPVQHQAVSPGCSPAAGGQR